MIYRYRNLTTLETIAYGLDTTDPDIKWITVRGNHIPIKNGQNKSDAVKEFFESKNKTHTEAKGTSASKQKSETGKVVNEHSKTVVDAEKRAMKLGIAKSKVNYGRLTPETCDIITDTLVDSYKEFPVVKDVVDTVGVSKLFLSDTLDACYRDNKEKINARFKEMLEKELPKDISDAEKEKITKQVKVKFERYMLNTIGLYGENAIAFYTTALTDSAYDGKKTSQGKNRGIFLTEQSLDSDVVEQTKKNLAESEKSGYHPVGCGTIKAMIDHEFGHALLVYLKDQKCTLPQEKLKDYMLDLDNLYYKNDKEYITKNLSEYATTNYEEFIAEAYAEYKNNPNPRPLCKKVVGLLKKYYNEAQSEIGRLKIMRTIGKNQFGQE